MNTILTSFSNGSTESVKNILLREQIELYNIASSNFFQEEERVYKNKFFKNIGNMSSIGNWKEIIDSMPK